MMFMLLPQNGLLLPIVFSIGTFTLELILKFGDVISDPGDLVIEILDVVRIGVRKYPVSVQRSSKSLILQRIGVLVPLVDE